MPSKREIEQERNALRAKLEGLYFSTQDLEDEIARALGWPDEQDEQEEDDEDEDDSPSDTEDD